MTPPQCAKNAEAPSRPKHVPTPATHRPGQPLTLPSGVFSTPEVCAFAQARFNALAPSTRKHIFDELTDFRHPEGGRDAFELFSLARLMAHDYPGVAFHEVYMGGVFSKPDAVPEWRYLACDVDGRSVVQALCELILAEHIDAAISAGRIGRVHGHRYGMRVVERVTRFNPDPTPVLVVADVPC